VIVGRALSIGRPSCNLLDLLVVVLFNDASLCLQSILVSPGVSGCAQVPGPRRKACKGYLERVPIPVVAEAQIVLKVSARNVVNALPLMPLILNRHRQYCESSGSAYSSAQPWQLLHSENPQGLSSTAQMNSKQKPSPLIYIGKHKFRPKRFKAWRLRCSTQY
jgi:hypothetical protein